MEQQHHLQLLKYFRLHSELDFKKALGREKISCCSMGNRGTVVLGTEAGMLRVMSSTGEILMSYKAHDRPVNDISVDFMGNIATCSDNGTAVIYVAPDDKNGEYKVNTVHLQEPILSICLEGCYSKSFPDRDNSSDFHLSNAGSNNRAGDKKRASEKNDNSSSSSSSSSASLLHKKSADLSFVTGTESGALTRHSSSSAWYSPKREVLFAGAGTPVTNIVWQGDMIAWADVSQVRIMNVATLAAICYLECPSGVDPLASFPVTLVWASDRDLFVGWADSFRHLELMKSTDVIASTTSPRQTASKKGLGKSQAQSKDRSSSGGSMDIIARTVNDWQADFLICGISAFDSEHVMLLGYTPPEESDRESKDLPDYGRSSGSGSGSGGGGGENLPQDSSGEVFAANLVEIQVCKLSSGETIVSDLLQIRGEKITSGPSAFCLCSSYHHGDSKDDALAWKVAAGAAFPDAGMNGNGNSGHGGRLAPKFLVISPHDIVRGTIRDVNDNVGRALQDMNLRLAVNLALEDRYGLTKYKYADLLLLYITHLLDEEKWDLAAKECIRLFDTSDGHLWERAILAFSQKKHVHDLAAFIPTDAPLLSLNAYEIVLEELRLPSPDFFALLVEKWSPLSYADNTPGVSSIGAGSRVSAGTAAVAALNGRALFDVDALLLRLQNGRSSSRSRWHLIAQAHLHQRRGDWDMAVTCYLDSTINATAGNSSIAEEKQHTHTQSQAQAQAQSQQQEPVYNYSHVFNLIELHNLFAVTQERVLHLTRFDAASAVEFLVRKRTEIPIPKVVQQIRGDRYCLHLYLHELFTNALEVYNVQEYAELHAQQVTLYAEFAPAFERTPVVAIASASVEKSSELLAPYSEIKALSTASSMVKVVAGAGGMQADSHFLRFLKLSNFAPQEVALRECERRTPPLYLEMIFIHTKLGNINTALELLLKEVGDVPAAIQFVEAHDPKLWAVLTEYALNDGVMLSAVLDYSGISANVSPASVVKKIPAKLQIPDLRKRLLRINDLCAFKQFVTDRCNDILAEDTIGLQRNLNRLQRRAIKLDPVGARCCTCEKPIFMPTDITGSSTAAADFAAAAAAAAAIAKNRPGPGQTSSSSQNKVDKDAKGGRPIGTEDTGTIWGRPIPPAIQASGVLVFGNKLVFHRQCYLEFLEPSRE